MIPLIRPRIPSVQEAEQYFTLSRDSGKFSNFGPCYQRLTAELSKRLHCYALPVADGTAAIRLALQTQLKRGSKVLLPDYTHIGTLNAVIEAGMQPILGDCDESTWTLSEAAILKAAKLKCQGMVVVSPFGYRVDFEFYDAIAEEFGIKLVYDLAGAWGLLPNTKNPFTYSLHATKNFSCGEGGIVCFSESAECESARKLSNFDTGSDRHIATPYGGNHKADEWTCANALAHLATEQRITAKIMRKKALISIYQAAFAEYCKPHDRHMGDDAAPSLCVLSGLPAKELELFGMRNGVELKQYYIPLTKMNGLRSIKRVSKSSDFFDQCVALPSDATDTEAEKVISVVKHWLMRRAKNLKS